MNPLEAAYVLSQKFLMQEGVAGVGLRGGSRVLRVYAEDWETASRVPSRLLGLPVEVVVTGRFRLLSSRTGRARPVPGGVSVGSAEVGAGTLTCRVYDAATGRKMLLSCRHVFWGGVGTRVLQPGRADGGRDPDDTVAVIARYAEIRPPPAVNPVDAALAEPLSEDLVSDEILGIGPVPRECAEPREGMRVVKSGRTTGVTEATVLDASATVKVYGVPGMEYALFGPVALTDAFLRPGDSGSPVLDGETGALAGIGFAGSDTHSLFCRASLALSALGASLSPGAPPPQPKVEGAERPSPLPFLPLGAGSLLIALSATLK